MCLSRSQVLQVVHFTQSFVSTSSCCFTPCSSLEYLVHLNKKNSPLHKTRSCSSLSSRLSPSWPRPALPVSTSHLYLLQSVMFMVAPFLQQWVRCIENKPGNSFWTRQLLTINAVVPVTNTPRQLGALGGLTSPVTGALSQAGKTVPPAVERAGDSLHPEGKKNATEPATAAKAAKPQSKSGLSGLTGILGGIVPAGLVPGL